MKTRIRAVLALAAAVVVAGSWITPLAHLPAAGAAAPAVGQVVDEPDDLMTDDSNKLVAPGAADIVTATGDYQSEGLALTVQVRTPADPSTDRAWQSEGTYISWLLDVDGDGAEDFDVRYWSDSGKVAGSVFPADVDDDSAEPLCKLASAAFDATRGHTAVIAPACIGNPAAVSYQVSIDYESVPGDDTSLFWDLAPDDFTGPIRRGADTSTPPVSSALPTPATSAPSGAGDPKPVLPLGSEPEAGPPVAVTTTSGSVQVPNRRLPDSGAANPRPATSSPGGRVVAENGVSTPAPDLARTGLSERTPRNVLFAIGIALIGIGLLFTNRRSAVP